MADQEQRPAFHAHSGWTFQRLPFGHVSVAPNSAAQAVSFTPETWASIVASTSEGGETDANWRAALAFHQDAHVHGEPTRIPEVRQQVLTALDAYLAARAYWVELHDAPHPSFAHSAKATRAWVAFYDAEQLLIDMRAILTGLEDKHAARRSQPQPPEEEEQRDPGDEHHGAGDTSPDVAHRPWRPAVSLATAASADLQPNAAHGPAQMPRSAVTAGNAIDGANAAPGTYVPPAGAGHTLASASGIAPAQLQHLAKLVAEAEVPFLQGWFTRQGALFNLNWDNANKVWIATWLNATHVTEGRDHYLLNALLALANAVLQQAGYSAVTYVATPQP